MALASDGRTLFVCERADAGSVSVIDIDRGERTNRIRLGDLPGAVAVAPDMSLLYVTTSNYEVSNSAGDGGRVYLVDPSTGRVAGRWRPGRPPRAWH
jgi:DNA-binding beta-propeller fold protein YncE